MKRFISIITTALCLAMPGMAQIFTEQEFIVKNGEYSLPGTLLTDGNKEKPVVVFVHGSGPNDRDETLGPNKFFAELAKGLSEKDIASLRYDKRTMLYKDVTPDFSFREETVSDAVQAVRQLKTEGFCHIFVAGHSLGGYLIPLIADEVKDIAEGVIMLSANTMSLAKTMEYQLNYLGKQQGVPEAMIRQTLDQMMATLLESYIAFDKAYKPMPIVKRVMNEAPQLRWMVVQGGHDYQATATDFTMWRMNLGMKAKYFFGESLDHLLRSLPEMATPQDYLIAHPVDTSAIDAIAEFIQNK